MRTLLTAHQTEQLEVVRMLVRLYGPKVADAYLAIARGTQPCELAAQRLMNSAARDHLVYAAGALAFARGTGVIVSQIERHEGAYRIRPAGPLLPPPHSKPPRPF
jgi:hypothetical protein